MVSKDLGGESRSYIHCSLYWFNTLFFYPASANDLKILSHAHHMLGPQTRFFFGFVSLTLWCVKTVKGITCSWARIA
ncbi:hypothetical protein ACFX13_020132 [Malus domestica]